LLERLIAERERLLTDAEVLREILHRYVTIDRRDAIQPAFDLLLGVVDEVLTVDRRAVERAKQIVLGYQQQLSARDAIHLSVVEQSGIRQILSFDSGLDGFPCIARLYLKHSGRPWPPTNVKWWKNRKLRANFGDYLAFASVVFGFNAVCRRVVGES
jgi:uncharacterized protein